MAMPSFSAESALYRTTHNYRSAARVHRGGDTIASDSNILIPAAHCTCPCCLEHACGDAGTCLTCCDSEGNIVQ
jgi:hypothetical protein